MEDGFAEIESLYDPKA